MSDYPLYLTVKQSAAMAGIGERAMAGYVDGPDPPPILMVGSRRYIQRASLPKYLEERQTWFYRDRSKADGRD